MTMELVKGWRYVFSLPGCQWVSKQLYSTQGAAIDAMLKAYPPGDYPDGEYSTMADDEPRV